MNKENVTVTPTFTRKRAKSFSTPPTAKPITTRSSRGILKGNNGDDAHTIAFIPIHSPSKKTSESAEKRRKSLSRRVSFASHASVRVFEKANNSSPLTTPQSTPRRSNRLSPAKSPIVDRLDDSPSKSPLTTRFASNEDEDDELTMDLTNIIPRQSNPLVDASSFSDEEDSENDSDLSGQEPGEDETSAMDLTDVLPVAASHATMSSAPSTPRQSRLPIRSRPSPRAAVYQDDDETQLMDMTMVYGAKQSVLASASPYEQNTILEDGMDMTRLVGGIISSAQTRSDGMASRTSSPAVNTERMTTQTSNEMEDEDHTVNMDETRIFTMQLSHDRSCSADEPTSHTSYTVATEEDDTQRLCEGSVTQADGFTQNMDLTRALPTQIRTGTRLSQVLSNSNVGFSWGATPVEETSLMDISMADVTQNDDTINMDITQAFPSTLSNAPTFEIAEDADSNETMNMDITRAVPTTIIKSPTKSLLTRSPGVLRPVTPQATEIPSKSTPALQNESTLLPGTPIVRSASKSGDSSLKRRLSSGAVRTPLRQVETPTKTPVVAALGGENKTRLTTPQVTPRIPRRKSLLEADIPVFGTPEAQVLLAPGSSKRPEFGSQLFEETDRRLSNMKEKIQSLTPKREAPSSVKRIAENADLSRMTSPTKKARFMTPQKTPQRSLLAPTASVSRTNSNTPARISTESPLPQTTLADFLKMTGISFLTGLSTTRRRETFVMPEKFAEPSDQQEREIQALMAEKYTVPMLEMYQHSCRELTRYITEGRAMCEEIESDMNEENPEIFDRYRRASPTEKRDLEAKFKELKTSARLSAKGVWYVWRENLLSGVLVPLRKNLADLEKESARLKEYKEKATPTFEQVQKEYDELKATVDELVREEDAYESFDHEEAAQLVASIEKEETELALAEAELQALEAQDAEMDAELAVLDKAYEEELAEVTRLEAQAEKHRGYSSEEIEEMQQSYKLLSEQTGLRVLHVTDSHIRMSMDDTLILLVDLAELRITLSLADNLGSNIIRDYYLAQIKQSLGESTFTSVRESVRFIRDRWTAVSRLMSELDIVESTYPLTVKINEDDNVQASAAILLPASRTKFLVHFMSTPLWSLEDCSLDVEVVVKYGGLDGAKVQQHIQARLHGQNLQDRSAGWLLESLRMPEGL